MRRIDQKHKKRRMLAKLDQLAAEMDNDARWGSKAARYADRLRRMGLVLRMDTEGGVWIGHYGVGPYVYIAGGVVRDGVNGPVIASGLVSGQKRVILAHLIVEQSIHAMEMWGLQATKPVDSLEKILERAEVVASGLFGPASLLLLYLPGLRKDRGSSYWDLIDLPKSPFTYSVRASHAKAQEAEKSLDAGDARQALILAIEAIRVDECVLLPHEVLCRAASMLQPDTLDSEQQRLVKASLAFVVDRIRRLGWMVELSQENLSATTDQPSWSSLPTLLQSWRSQQTRLEQAAAPIRTWLDNSRENRELRFVDGLIVEVRAEKSLGAGPREDSRIRTILGSTPVQLLYEWINKNWDRINRKNCAGWRERVEGEIINLIRDPNCPPNILAICGRIRELLLPKEIRCDRDRKVAAFARKWQRWRQGYRQQHGQQPTDEEAREALGMSDDDYREVLAYLRRETVRGIDYLGNIGDDSADNTPDIDPEVDDRE